MQASLRGSIGVNGGFDLVEARSVPVAMIEKPGILVPDASTLIHLWQADALRLLHEIVGAGVSGLNAPVAGRRTETAYLRDL